MYDFETPAVSLRLPVFSLLALKEFYTSAVCYRNLQSYCDSLGVAII